MGSRPINNTIWSLFATKLVTQRCETTLTATLTAVTKTPADHSVVADAPVAEQVEAAAGEEREGYHGRGLGGGLDKGTKNNTSEDESSVPAGSRALGGGGPGSGVSGFAPSESFWRPPPLGDPTGGDEASLRQRLGSHTGGGRLRHC